MLSRAGVGFVDLVVGRECLVGDDGGDLDRGLPPCQFGWSGARAVATLLFALWRDWLLLALGRECRVFVINVRLTMDDERWRLVRRYGTGLSAWGALVT